MTMAVSKALEEGSSAIVCASTETHAAAAAYAARAGMKCFVLCPKMLQLETSPSTSVWG